MSKYKVSSLALAVALSATYAPMAWAGTSSNGNQQASQSDTGGLSEIIITARRTSELAQNSPLAVSAISAKQLEVRGVQQVSDIARSVPNVTFMPGDGHYGKAITAFVRGVGQVDSRNGFEPAVGFYVDDVYIGSLTGSDLELVDIDSVEVLRGPQGTLFGANTESGAVQIHTKKPRGDNSGYIELGYGSRNQYKARGGFDIPIIEDVLALRASFTAEKQDGYVDVLDFACVNPNASTMPRQVATTQSDCKIGTQGGKDLIAGRLALRWQVSEAVTIDLTASASKDDGEVSPTTLLALGTNPLIDAYEPLVGWNISPTSPLFIPNNPYANYTSFYDPLTGKRFPAKNTLEASGFSGTITWDLPNGIRLKSVTAYNQSEGAFPVSLNYTPIPLGMFYNTTRNEQFSEEINISGKSFNDRFEWAAGLFYYNGNSNFDSDNTMGFLEFPFNIDTWQGLRFTDIDHSKDVNKSVFFNTITHITDKLSLEVGARYTDKSKDFTLHRTWLDGTIPFPTVVSNGETQRTDPKIGLKYQFTPDVMLYASYATGFKGGGVNPYVIYGAADVSTFEPEEVENYEIGAKTEFFNRRLRINGAIFQMNYSNLQQTIATTVNNQPIQPVVNLGSAEIRGLELEIEARPTSNLLINASLGYVDYETKECGLACTSGFVKQDGMAPFTPELKYNLGAQYTFDLGSAGRLIPRIDYSHQSRMYVDGTNITSVDPYGLVNISVRWEDVSNKWAATLAVRNAGDELYYLTKYDLLGPAGNISGSIGAPREVSLTLKRTF